MNLFKEIQILNGENIIQNSFNKCSLRLVVTNHKNIINYAIIAIQESPKIMMNKKGSCKDLTKPNLSKKLLNSLFHSLEAGLKSYMDLFNS